MHPAILWTISGFPSLGTYLDGTHILGWHVLDVILTQLLGSFLNVVNFVS